MELVKKLRDTTQVGMMDCKKALEDAQGDFEKAVEILRKKGAAVAAKRAENVTNHGRIEGYVTANNGIGVLVEMGCETDFAANTDSMRLFADDLAEHIANQNPTNVETLLSQPLHKNQKVTVRQHLDTLIAKICENIKINRFARFEVTKHGLVTIYVHPGSTVGVMIELETSTSVTPHIEELKSIAKDLCMQIAVTNPLCIQPNELSADVLTKEREVAREQLKDSGKPTNVIDKIVEGKLSKFYQDACLLNQPFIKNDKNTIQQYITECSKKFDTSIRVKQFKRFGIGR